MQSSTGGLDLGAGGVDRFVRVELILKTLEWLKSHGTVVSNLFGNRDQFHGRQLFRRPGVEGWFGDDLNALHFLCTLFLI